MWRFVPELHTVFPRLFLLYSLLFLVLPVQASVTEPDPRASDAFDFMNLLSKKGLHDLKNERWNAYGQFTYISSWKNAFPAAYTNLNGTPNSLLPDSERSFSGTGTFQGMEWRRNLFLAGFDFYTRLVRFKRFWRRDTKLRVTKRRF